MTYQEIRKQQAGSNPWLQSLSPEDYSRVMGQITGAPQEYASGVDPSWLAQADYYINRGIEATGLPEAAGQLGEAAFGETGRQVFHGVPRTILNMAPLAIPGGQGVGLANLARLGAMGAMTGMETWGATEKPLPSVLSGAFAAAIPKIMHTAGGAAIQAMKTPEDAVRATALRAMMTEAPERAAAFAPGLAAHTTAATTPGQVIAGLAAGQAGLTVGQTGIEAINIAADPDRHFSELASPEYWAATALAQGLFGGLDVARAPGLIRGANRMRGMLTSGETQMATGEPGRLTFEPEPEQIAAQAARAARPVAEGPVYGPEPDQRLALYVQNLARGTEPVAETPAGPLMTPELPGLDVPTGPLPDARPTRHRVFESPPPIAVKPGPGVLPANDPTSAFRLTGQEQIDDMLSSGTVRAREGKMRGGRSGETQWSRGHEALGYRAETNEGKYVIKTRTEDLHERQGGLPLSEVEQVWKAEDGQWVEVTDRIKLQERGLVKSRPAMPPEEVAANAASPDPVNKAKAVATLPPDVQRALQMARDADIANGSTPEEATLAAVNRGAAMIADTEPTPPPSLEADMATFAQRLELAKTDPAVDAETKFVLAESARFGEKIGSGSAPDPTYTAYREWLEAGQPEGFDMFKARLRMKVNEQGKGERGRVTFTEFVGDDLSLAKHSEEATRAEAPEPVLSTGTVPGEGPVAQAMRDPVADGEAMAALAQDPSPEARARLDALSLDRANATPDERIANAGTFFGKAMRSMGMSEAEMAQRLPTVARLWTAVKELAGTDLAQLTEKGRQAYGLFVAGGHPLVLLSGAPRSAKLMGYTVAHELIGHGLWDAHARGQLEPKVSMQLDRTRRFVEGALPEDRALMLKWMTEGLPAELRKSPELAEILRTAETIQSPDEVLAHMNALAAMHMVEGRTSNLNGLVKYLPKPLSDFLVNAAQWASKSIRTLKMAFRGNKEMWDTLAGHEEAMKDVMRAGRETEVDALRLQAFAKMQEPGGLMDIMQDPAGAGDWFSTVFDTSEFDGYGKDVAKWMVGPQMFKDMAREGKNVAGAFGGLGGTLANALTHIFRPLPQQGASKKAFRHAGELMPRRERMMATAQKAFADIMSGKTIGPWLSFGKDAPLTQFYKKADAESMKAKDELFRWVNPNDRSKTAYEHVLAGTPEVMAIFNRIAPEHQNNAKALLAQQDKLARTAVKDRNDRAVTLAASRTASNAIADTDVRYEDAHGFFHSYADKVKAGEPVDYQAMLQEAVPVLTSPGEDPRIGVDRATRYVESFKDQVELAADRTAYNMENIGYTTERRLGAHRITFVKNGETGFLAADSPKDMKQLMETLKREGATDVKEAEAGLTVMPGERVSDMEKGLGAVRERGRLKLQAKGYSEAEIAEILGSMDVRPELMTLDAQKDISSTHIKAKRAPGREYLDMTKQQWDWEQANLRQDTMAIADAEMRGVQNDKALMDTPEARTLAVAFNNYKTPDTASMKRISKFGYFMTLAGSPSNMALEVIQPIIAFPWKLVDEGAGPIQAHRLVTGSYKKVFGAMLSPKALKSGNMDLSKLSADHQKVIQEAIDNGRLNSQLLNEFGDEGPTTAIFREGAVTLGKLSPNAAEPVQDMAQAAGKLAIKVHNKATNLSTSVALLSGYDFLRSKGLDHTAAMREVWPLLSEGLYTGGRESRAAGIYDVGSARPVSSMTMSLTGYSLNTLAQMAGYIARSTRKGIPRAERMSSVKAAAGMIATQVLFAGMMGLPGVGAAVRIFEKATGFDLEKWLEQLSDAGEDPGTSAMVKTLSMRGISHVLGGPDVSQRMGVTSILGFNEFDGFNLENLFGPVGSYAKKGVEAVGSLARGDVRSAAEAVAPVPLRKTLQLWADDWEFRSPTNDELLIKDPSMGDKISYALGWQPVKLNRARQAWAMSKRAREAQVEKDKRVMGELADEIVDEKDVGEALKFLDARELERGPDFDRRAEAMKIAERVEKRVFVRDPGKEGTRVTGQADEAILRAMGVSAPTEEMARAQLRDNVLGALGAKGYGHKALESYRQIDELRRRNPFLTVAQARAQLQGPRRTTPPALRALLPLE